jgi:hypothetical protein
MSLERTDRGTTLETGTGEQPQDQAPPKDTPGAPGYPSRRESQAIARGEAPTTQTDSQGTDEQTSSADKNNGEPKQDSQRGRNEREDRQNSSSETGATEGGERPGSSGQGESLTPRADSRRAAMSSEQPTDSGTRDTTGPEPSRKAEEQAGDEWEQRPGEEPTQDDAETQPADAERSPVPEPREPDARENEPETNDGAPRLGPEHPTPGQEAGELPPSPGEAEPAPEETRAADGSWNAPQEPAEVADDAREPLVPMDGEGPHETAQPADPTAETDREPQGDPPEAGRAETTEPAEADDSPEEPDPGQDDADPNREHTDPSTELAEPAESQEPATREDSPFRAQAYVGPDGEVRWVLMPDLEVQGPGYEGPRSADRGDPLQPVDEEKDAARDPDKPQRRKRTLEGLNYEPDDAVKQVNSTVARLIVSQPDKGHASSVKDTRPHMHTEPMHQPHAADLVYSAAGIGFVLVGAARAAKNYWTKLRGRR